MIYDIANSQNRAGNKKPSIDFFFILAFFESPNHVEC